MMAKVLLFVAEGSSDRAAGVDVQELVVTSCPSFSTVAIEADQLAVVSVI